MADGFPREWALKWIEGSVVSYIQGKTTLPILLGRIKKALDNYGVRKSDVLAIIDAIWRSPAYIPSLGSEEKLSRLEPLKKALESQ